MPQWIWNISASPHVLAFEKKLPWDQNRKCLELMNSTVSVHKNRIRGSAMIYQDSKSNTAVSWHRKMGTSDSAHQTCYLGHQRYLGRRGCSPPETRRLVVELAPFSMDNPSSITVAPSSSIFKWWSSHIWRPEYLSIPHQKCSIVDGEYPIIIYYNRSK